MRKKKHSFILDLFYDIILYLECDKRFVPRI
jgi:hypothetical protein